MRNALLSLSALVCFTCPQLKAGQTPGQTNESTNGLGFTENKGQIHDQYYHARPDVLFSGQSGAMNYHLRRAGISYQLCETEQVPAPGMHQNSGHQTNIALVKQIYRVDVQWPGCNTQAEIVTDEALPGYSNYFNEVCPNGVMEVKSYHGLTYKNIYAQIDLHYYTRNAQLKYDYLVAAGADYKHIQLEWKGAEKIKVNGAGQLVIQTPLGTIVEQAPLVMQGSRILASRWKLLDRVNNRVGFEIDGVDGREAMVIDPVVRAWGSYYGGNAPDYGNFACTDANGNVYMSGSTNSVGGNAIATTGSHQLIFASGHTLGSNNSDAYLVKFNSVGLRQWATYYGSAGIETGGGVACDASGNVYFAGTSTSFGTIAGTAIATSIAHQSANAGQEDAFLAKFNSNGARQWATYYGGSGSDAGAICLVDASGNVYLGGTTTTTVGTGVATAGGHQPAYGGNSCDAFLAKFNSSGTRQWGTYYGGSGIEYGFGGAVDVSGDVYLCGYVNSNQGNIISTVGSHQPNYAGSYDAFLVKFNTAGVRQWGTYYGGGGEEIAFGCATDPSGNVYLGGNTNTGSSNAISTFGSHQVSYASSLYDDAFLVKFNSAGVRQWGTYYGGVQAESACRCMCDANGNAYLLGTTATTGTGIISTNGSHQAGYGGGQYDGFIAKFNGNGARLWGSYYGGSGTDAVSAGTCDPFGNPYMVGYTTTFGGSSIAPAGNHQSTAGGGTNDGFIVKLVDCPFNPPTNTSPLSGQEICENQSATLTATASGNILWFNTPLGTLAAATGSIYVTGTLTTGLYTFYAESQYCVAGTGRTPITVTVYPLPTLNPSSNSVLLCAGNPATLTVSGASTYTWSEGSFSNSISVTPTITTTYTVTGIDGYGCVNTATLVQAVDACTGINKTDFNNQLLVYPNPFNHRLSIMLKDGKKHRLQLTNILGEIVMSANAEQECVFDTAMLLPGVYVLNVEGSGGYKIIKQ